MRCLLSPGKVTALLVLTVSMAASSYADSIPVKGRSGYGENVTTYGTVTGTFTGGSFAEETFCPSNGTSTLGSGATGCTLGYDFLLSTLTPPAGSTSLTIDFPTAVSGTTVTLLFCDNATDNFPCGSLTTAFSFSGSLGADGTGGQELIFTNLTQLQGQQLAMLFVDANPTAITDADGNPITPTFTVPQFTATWGTAVATPEPSSILLLGVGLLGFLGMARRPRKASDSGN